VGFWYTPERDAEARGGRRERHLRDARASPTDRTPSGFAPTLFERPRSATICEVIVHFGAFVGISLVVIIAPGPDTVLVTKNAIVHGRGAALGTCLGVNAGLLIWTVAAALGVAAVVRESAVAFTALKLVGAIYLIWLGLQALLAARRRSAHAPDGGGDRGRRVSALTGFRQGLLSDLSNPKIAVFFTGLLSQFVAPRESVLLPFLLLGGVFVVMTLVWLSCYALFAAKMLGLLTNPSLKATLDRITGVVLIGLGVRLALERR
jgi:threonine/homoserine/homoserine lactone efflux protein